MDGMGSLLAETSDIFSLTLTQSDTINEPLRGELSSLKHAAC